MLKRAIEKQRHTSDSMRGCLTLRKVQKETKSVLKKVYLSINHENFDSREDEDVK
jgi:hypothetical protein